MPSLSDNGIQMDRDYLPRFSVVDEIVSTATKLRYVVLGSPAGTGKTSLLQLVHQKLEDDGAKVIRINMSSLFDAGFYAQRLVTDGIDVTNPLAMEQIKDTWLLLDDAQRTYDRKYDPFWESIVKDISTVRRGGLHVVIAATYDLSTPKSPACFASLAHIAADIDEAGAKELLGMHFAALAHENSQYGNWYDFQSTQLKMSVLLPVTKTPKFHLGVLMAGIHFIHRMKGPSRPELTEEIALEKLRGADFVQLLKRCFGLEDLEPDYKDRLLDAVIGRVKVVSPDDASLGPFIRAGVLTKECKFSTIAASWFYNDQCFPNRAMVGPENLESLVKSAVQNLSAQRLRDTLENGFPKEATFQHLFNEEMAKLLPVGNKLIPELNTIAEPLDGGNGTGELDFFINGNLNWCLELLRLGDKIRKHLARFDPVNGKYRNVSTKQYLVVDCRGPKVGRGCTPNASRCTLYFSEDFQTCLCKMRLEEEVLLKLAN